MLLHGEVIFEVMYFKFLLRAAIVITVFLGLPFIVNAQSKKDSAVATQIHELEKVWIRYRILILDKLPDGYLSSASKIFTPEKAKEDNELKYKNAWQLARAEKYDRDPGLEWNSNFFQNFKPSNDDEQDLIYRQRFQTGLDWNIFKDGLVANDLKAKQLRNEAKLDNLLSQESAYEKNISQRSAELIYRFNLEKIKILDKRKNIADEKVIAINRLHELDAITNLQRIQTQQSVVQINYELQLYNDYKKAFEQIEQTDSADKVILPLVDLKFDEYLKAVRGLEPANDSILKLQLENTNLQSNSMNRVGLRGSLKYNYYDPFYSDTKRNFFSVGLSLSVPIGLAVKENRNEALARNEWIKSRFGTTGNELFAEQLNIFYEFRYKLKQYLTTYEKTKETQELLRIERVRHQFNDAEFNPVHALDLLDQLQGQKVELIDIKQQMYLHLLRLSAYHPETNIGNYLMPVKLDSLENKFVSENFDKSVYIWSEGYESLTPQFIAEFLSNNKISNAIVSVKANASENENKNAIALFETLKRYTVSAELLIGNNNLVNQSSKEVITYLDSIRAKAGKNISALHLDVEPHTFADYKGKEEKYLSEYIKMLYTVKQYAKGKNIKVNVSIPLHYKPSYVKQIFETADNVYLMCYENKNIESLAKKINESAVYGKTKTKVALRTNDFESLSDLQQFLKQLAAKTGINAYAIHDLTRMVKMEN